LKSNISFQLLKAELMMKKIYGSLADYATVTKLFKPKRLTLKLIKLFRFSIRELKIGTSILNGKTNLQSAKRLAVG
jgi:hypothetical protein